MRIALIHNAGAGDGSVSDRELVELFRGAGHQVDLFGKRRRDVERAVRRGADVLAVAGGDGTVAKAVIAASKAGLETPVLILAVGTSNNIARSLGIDRPVEDIVSGFAGSIAKRLDVGAITVGDESAAFVEAAGIGFIGAMLELKPTRGQAVARAIRDRLTTKASLAGRKARGVARLIRAQPAYSMTIVADGEDLSGEYIAAEAMNIRDIGPRVTLAPGADSGDGLLDLVLIRDRDREALADYVATRVTLDRLPCGISRRVRSVEMSWPVSHGHVDDAALRAEENVTAHARIDGGVMVLCP